VKQHKTCLAVLLLAVGLATPSAAQQVSFVPETGANEPCAEYFGCLHYGILTEAQARTARGHPQFVEPQAASASQTRDLTAMPDRAVHTSRPVARTHQ
jgi:hypothetical protein